VIGALMDVSERQRLQEQLQQSQKMEAIGRLAGGIAHDFNNVLTGILISTDLLLNGDQSHNATAEELQHIRSAAERAADLTRQLLAFSRKQVIALRRIDLNEVVHGFGVMLQRLIGENVELRLELAEKLGAVRADPGQIEQILLNLAVNARDAMPAGGKLTLETANVDLDEAFSREQRDLAPGPYVLVAVGDTGVGMDTDIRDRIFEPFFTTKEPGKGTGLGLSTVYGIVRQHGGDIRVLSEVARGTTFKIYLPRVDGPPELQAKPAGDTTNLDGTETILLVEDEERVRELTRRILVRHGYSVLPAGDANEALGLAGRGNGRIDLLITDVVLPGASGPELANELVARGFTGPVLFLSGYSEDAVMCNGHLQPHALFLGKPFTTTNLALKVREALATRVGAANGKT
jgi:nitrogen-specific signal transduction histidine kinase/CheY-like chemotaxis protein